MSTALIFPGQGSEEPGMGLAFADADAGAAELLDAASATCGVDVRRAIERGGRDLGRTEVLQPTLVAIGLASARAIEGARVRIAFVAGHSLGELTAACWATNVEPEEAIELAFRRGTYMAAARAGGMMAIRAPRTNVEDALERSASNIQVALYNAPDEVVVAGDPSALRAFARELRVPTVMLRAAGAWHTEHMRAAVEPFTASLQGAFTKTLRARIFSARSGCEVHLSDLSRELAEGLVSPVRFVEVLAALQSAGVRRAIVAAPSRTVRALIRRTLGTRIELFGADDPASVARIAKG